MTFEIVPFAREHVAAVSELEALCFTDPYSPSVLSGVIGNDNYTAFAATVNGEAVGYVEIADFIDAVSLNRVEVAPEYRRRGIAEALLGAAEAAARAGTAEKLWLEVRVSNAPARSLYEKYGFVFQGVCPACYSSPREDAAIYYKDISGKED